MTSKRAANSVTPNGQEIRKLRLAKGQTQQQFVKQGGITQRTLQRAEQGKDVGAQHISAIAKLLEVPTEQLVKATDDHKGADAQKDVIRLNPVGGRWLMDHLQPYGPNEVACIFDIDPNSEVSELIAGVVEFFDKHHIEVGLLNDKLAALRLQQVGVFSSVHYFWEAQSKEMEGTNMLVWIPTVKRSLLVAFGSAERDFLTQFEYDFYKKKPVYDFCIDKNLRENVDPEIVRKHARMLFDDDFTPLYRQCWDARRATVAGNTTAIALVPQK